MNLDDTMPGADPAPAPAPVFEWLGGVITSAAHRLGVPAAATGTISEERRHHAAWTWPASGRSVTLVETIPHGRQILAIRSGGLVAWFEGRDLKWFPGLEDVIYRALGVPLVRRISNLSPRPEWPDTLGYPPIQ